MNRRGKIIVSITGITLVLLILVGLTYAYFLTRIQGNTNNKSISLTTADLSLVYADGNTNIITKEKIIPGDVIGTKDFTVTNNGTKETEYIVVIDDVVITNLSTNPATPTDFESNDFVFTLTCESSDNVECNGVATEERLPLTDDTYIIANKIAATATQTYHLTVTYKETGVDQSADMNKKLEAKIDIRDARDNPYSSNHNLLAYHIINNAASKKNGTVLRNVPLTKPAEMPSLGTYIDGISYQVGEEITEWTNTGLAGEYWLYFDDTNVGEMMEAVQEFGTSGNPTVLMPYLTNNCSDTINKYIVIAESLNSTETYYISGCSGNNPIVGDAEKTLGVTSDDLGTSYYFRGNPIDNYVDFAGMCWRIVRIEGDGSIKLILEDQDYITNGSPCASSNGNWDIPTTTGGNTTIGNFGYDNSTYSGKDIASYLNPVTDADESQIYAFYNFQNSLSSANKNKLKAGNWCYDDKAYTTTTGGSVITDKSSYYTNGTAFYYDSYVRLSGVSGTYNPTLKCNGRVLNSFNNVTYNNNVIITSDDMYVGTLTADEIIYAGGTTYLNNPNYYLINGQNLYWWSLSPSYFDDGIHDRAFCVEYDGDVDGSFVVHDVSSFRPSVSLSFDTTISGGDGTKTNAYAIN